MPGYLQKFPKCLGFWENPQISSHLKNFQILKKNTTLKSLYKFGKFLKFPKCLGFLEIPQIYSHLRYFQNIENIPPTNSYRNFRNFGNLYPNSHMNLIVVYFKYLRNFPDAWVYGKFPKCLGIWVFGKFWESSNV